MKKILPEETEKPKTETLLGSASQSPSRELKRGMTITKLRESFSLHQMTESSFGSPKNVKQQHSSPRHRHLLSNLSTSSPVNSQKSDPNKETDCWSAVDSNTHTVIGTNLKKLENDTDSGCGSTSLESNVSFSTPEMGSCLSSESTDASPEEEFHISDENLQSGCLETVTCAEESLECDVQLSRNVHKLNQVGDQKERRGFLPNSFPNMKRFKSKKEDLKGTTCPELKNAQNSAPGLHADVLIEVQKKTVTLEFSMNTLAERVRKLTQLQQKNIEMLNYRRFKAKISPGENKAAEDELRKEIRYLHLPNFYC